MNQHIQLQKLSEDPVWKALLQLSRNSPQIHDPNFYISQSYKSSYFELTSFLDALHAPDAKATACRFPARYFWLKKKLPLHDIDLNQCEGLFEFITRAPLETASVVFATENLAQPASMMGHIFFKFGGTNSNNIYVEHVISFFTDLNDINFPKLIIQSLLTGKRGLYALSPYEQTRVHYLYEEQRNLWEYRLNLSEDEKIFLHYYFYELKDVSFTYYFHLFNCGTLVKNILAILHPELLDDWSLWVTPLDVARLLDQPSYVEKQVVQASSRWKIKALNESLSLDSSEEAKIEHRNFAELNFEKKNQKNQFLSFELALAYNDYSYEKDQITKADWNLNRQLLITKKDKILPYGQLDISNYKKPSATIQDSQIFISGLESANSFISQAEPKDRILLVGFLPASHTLFEDNTQYQNESELKIGEVTLSYKPLTQQVELNSFVLYSAISLQPSDPYTGGLSGLFRLGVEPKKQDNLGFKKSFFLEGGLGQTFRLLHDIDLFYLAKIGAESETEAYLAFAPQFGLIVREVFNMKTLFSVEHEFRLNRASYLSQSVTQVYNARRFSIAIQFNQYEKKARRPDDMTPENFSQNFVATYKLFF
ncbi:MAG: DUF4105 domain-containing protein [Bdellovibrio sp.]|nr:DUF4105 domain-containing protein [Bdellovibrio sp.]